MALITSEVFRKSKEFLLDFAHDFLCSQLNNFKEFKFAQNEFKSSVKISMMCKIPKKFFFLKFNFSAFLSKSRQKFIKTEFNSQNLPKFCKQKTAFPTHLFHHFHGQTIFYISHCNAKKLKILMFDAQNCQSKNRHQLHKKVDLKFFRQPIFLCTYNRCEMEIQQQNLYFFIIIFI